MSSPKKSQLKRMMPTISATKRKQPWPEMHYLEFMSAVSKINTIRIDNVKAYSWTITHRKRDYPKIKIIMLVNDVKTCDEIIATIEKAFEDIDSLAIILTSSNRAFMSMTKIQDASTP
jgi:hypothetical protein